MLAQEISQDCERLRKDHAQAQGRSLTQTQLSPSLDTDRVLDCKVPGALNKVELDPYQTFSDHVLCSLCIGPNFKCSFWNNTGCDHCGPLFSWLGTITPKGQQSPTLISSSQHSGLFLCIEDSCLVNMETKSIQLKEKFYNMCVHVFLSPEQFQNIIFCIARSYQVHVIKGKHDFKILHWCWVTYLAYSSSLVSDWRFFSGQKSRQVHEALGERFISALLPDLL